MYVRINCAVNIIYIRYSIAAVLTDGLEVHVDEVEAVVLERVVGLGRYVQVAVTLLVTQVHLDV